MISKGAILAIAVGLAGATGMLAAFMSTASPYVDIEQAKKASANNLHLAGDINRDSLQVDARQSRVAFTLTDEKGDTVPVVYEGHTPANMGDATRVVAVGGMRDGVFKADKLLLKCPSKYESKEKA